MIMLLNMIKAMMNYYLHQKHVPKVQYSKIKNVVFYNYMIILLNVMEVTMNYYLHQNHIPPIQCNKRNTNMVAL